MEHFTITEFNRDELRTVFNSFQPNAEGKIHYSKVLFKLQDVQFIQESSEDTPVVKQTNSKSAPTSPNKSADVRFNFQDITQAFPNGQQEIDFEQFLCLMQNALNSDQDSLSKHIFSLIDSNQNGLLEPSEFSELAISLGLDRVPEEQAQRLMSLINPSNDGSITFAEFFRYFTNEFRNG